MTFRRIILFALLRLPIIAAFGVYFVRSHQPFGQCGGFFPYQCRLHKHGDVLTLLALVRNWTSNGIALPYCSVLNSSHV